MKMSIENILNKSKDLFNNNKNADQINLINKINEKSNEMLSIKDRQIRSKSAAVKESANPIMSSDAINSESESSDLIENPNQMIHQSQSLNLIDLPLGNELIPKENKGNELSVGNNSQAISNGSILMALADNSKRLSIHQSFEMVRNFNKQQSEEEKEALNIKFEKVNLLDITEFKSRFYKFCNDLAIPQKKRESTIVGVKKKESPITEKVFSPKENILKNSPSYLNKINLDFTKKNQNYLKFSVQNLKLSQKKSFIDKNYLRKQKSLYLTRFEENNNKFFEKMMDFYNYHHNPFNYDESNQMDFKSKLIKTSFFQEKNAINLSEILSKKEPSSHIRNNSFLQEASSSENSNAEDESVYNFLMKKNNEKFTIKISPPEGIQPENEAGALNRSFTNNLSPITQETISKRTKVRRSSSNKRMLDSIRRNFFNNVKQVFEELDQKSGKIFNVYNYRHIWKLFKIVFFTSLQIFLPENYYEILMIDSKIIQNIEKNLIINKEINKRRSNFSYNVNNTFNPCFVLDIEKNEEIFMIKNLENEELLAFDYKLEINEKNDEKEESDFKKNIIKVSYEEGDSPMIWDTASKFYATLDEDLQISLNKMNDSEMSVDKDEYNYELENEKNYIRLKNGKKIEMVPISFKTLQFILKYLNICIMPSVTNLDLDSKNSIQKNLPSPQLNFNKFFNENGNFLIFFEINFFAKKENLLKAMTEKKIFIEQSVKKSKELNLLIKMNLLNHQLIDRGGFEDFILIPSELVLIFFQN